jgi:hypothetical protein
MVSGKIFDQTVAANMKAPPAITPMAYQSPSFMILPECDNVMKDTERIQNTSGKWMVQPFHLSKTNRAIVSNNSNKKKRVTASSVLWEEQGQADVVSKPCPQDTTHDGRIEIKTITKLSGTIVCRTRRQSSLADKNGQ